MTRVRYSCFYKVSIGTLDIMQKKVTMMVMMTADAIRTLRLALGMTPKDFAERLGVSLSTVCLWEQGKRHPHYKMMVALNELDRERKELAGA